MKLILAFVILITSSLVNADDIAVIKVSAINCKQGAHFQPNGPYAVYVFCDDALATNIAIFFDKLRDPIRGKYSLHERFWQDFEWGSDVSSFAWLKDREHIIVATSRIYGTGKVFKLELETQAQEVVYYPGEDICLTEIVKVEFKKLTLKITDCDMKSSEIQIAI